MDLLRSEPMQLAQLIIPIESSHQTISRLGDLSIFQFKDLNAEKSPFQRTFALQVKRCSELARRLSFFKEQMAKGGVTPSMRFTSDAHINFVDLELKLGELEAELREINGNNEKLQRSYHELSEYKLVLQKVGDFFNTAQRGAVEHQRRSSEVHLLSEGSMESPLLKEKYLQTHQK